jgi:hypothetical protein
MRYASWQSRLESSGGPEVCRELQMPEDVFDDLCRRDGRAEPQRLLVAKRTDCYAAER